MIIKEGLLCLEEGMVDSCVHLLPESKWITKTGTAGHKVE